MPPTTLLLLCGDGRMQGGLDRLAEAANTVDELTKQAEAQRSLLTAKQSEADAALTNIQVGRTHSSLITACPVSREAASVTE